MALFETWLKSDLKKPLRVEQLRGNLFSSDNGGNLIGVEVLDDGSPATLSGGVTGYAIRADGATVAITGSLSGNRASIVLPASAYIVPGQISIAIKIGTTTVGACTAYVYRTTTNALVDPGHVIPSIEELLAKIADCEAATTAATAAASSANTAASTANTAATGADTAAGSANTAAGSANTAASTANAAAQKIDGMTVAASGLAAGSSPTATVSEVSGHKHIAFGIPKGDTGETPDFTIGDVETLLPGEDAYVELDESSTPEEPVLNFGIPQGNPGSITDAFASNIAMSPTDPTTVKDAMDEKMDEPETAGTEGQVLTSDGEGGQIWKDMSLDKYREASGSIVHVEDAVAEPVKNLEIEIAPVQSGTGDPSPDNVRPITGWAECEVTVANGDDPTATGYEAEEYTVEFPTEAGTVYGGTLNVTTGVLTVNKIGIDLGSEEWTYDSQYARFASGDHTDIKYTKARELPGICSCYPVISDGRNVEQVPDKTIYGGRKSTSASAARKLYIKDSSFGSDASALTTAMQGQIFVCERETAEVYQLTPTEVRTLLGENYIYADTGDIISLVYPINEYVLTETLEAGLDTKVDKNQGTQNAGKALGINAQGMVEPVPFSGDDFTGATSSTNGARGYVPAPLAGDQDKVLMGDGTWSDSLPEAVGGVKSSLALVENGDTATQNIDKGKYVLWKGVMCRAASAISSGDTLSSTNLTEVSGGGLNNLPAFEDVSKCIFRGNLYNTHDVNNLEDGIYYIASTIPAHAPAGYNWSILYQITVADTMRHQYILNPVSASILMREYSGNPSAWGDWRNACGYGVSWGTNFTAYLPNNVALICVNSYLRIQVFLGGTTDVNVTVELIGSSGITSFIKTGTNSVTFGDSSASGNDYTITRSGRFITVTRGSNAAMICKC